MQLTLGTTCLELHSVRARWKNLRIQLDIDKNTLDAIEVHHVGNPDNCLTDMLDSWLKQTNPPPSWYALAEALQCAPVGEGHLAEQIRQKYCTQFEGHIQDSSDLQPPLDGLQNIGKSTKKYSKHLKSLYKASVLIPDNKWPRTPSTKFINLACIDRETVTKHEVDEFTNYAIQGHIDDICHKKTQISIEQVACKVEGSYPKVVLVGGAPGVGKTTFAWELCRRWARGELLQDYSLVVLLRLRDKSVREAKELEDLFSYPPKKSLSKSIVDEVIESETNGVLEGFDELPEIMRTESSIYIP